MICFLFRSYVEWRKYLRNSHGNIIDKREDHYSEGSTNIRLPKCTHCTVVGCEIPAI